MAAAKEMLANADLSIFEKYGINPEDARKAWDELMTWGAGDGADATDEEGARQGEAILARYGIDAEDFGKAIAEMFQPGIEEMQAAFPPCPAEGETLPADFEHGCTIDDTIQIAAEGDSCWTFGDFYAEFGDRIVKRQSGEDDPAVSAVPLGHLTHEGDIS